MIKYLEKTSINKILRILMEYTECIGIPINLQGNDGEAHRKMGNGWE